MVKYNIYMFLIQNFMGIIVVFFIFVFLKMYLRLKKSFFYISPPLFEVQHPYLLKYSIPPFELQIYSLLAAGLPFMNCRFTPYELSHQISGSKGITLLKCRSHPSEVQDSDNS